MKRPLLLLGLVALGACARMQRPAPPAAREPADDALVYAAVIDHLTAPGTPVLLVDSIAPAPEGVALEGAPDEGGLLSSFAKANQARRALPAPIPTEHPLRLVKERDLPFRRLQKKRDVNELWGEFRAAFPGYFGYYTLSGVGYDEERSRAVVYAGHHCGGVCGSGHRLLLSHDGTRWRVEENRMVWVS